MIDEFRLTHLQSLRHPVEESKVGPQIEIDEFAHEVARMSGTGPAPSNVPFGKVDSVINGLDSEKSKGQEESKGTQYVD